MYHDTIRIQFYYNNWKDISFNYSFFISKYPKYNFSPILYSELLSKFNGLGFNLKYLKFNDIDENSDIYCSYNYQPNFNIFFSAYNKLIKSKSFDIKFEYGSIISGVFYPNNMNFCACYKFKVKGNFNRISTNIFTPLVEKYNETVISGKEHIKVLEIYQIIDKEGKIIHQETTDASKNFEQHFFENYDVKVATRKYKLGRLKLFNSED